MLLLTAYFKFAMPIDFQMLLANEEHPIPYLFQKNTSASDQPKPQQSTTPHEKQLNLRLGRNKAAPGHHIHSHSPTQNIIWDSKTIEINSNSSTWIWCSTSALRFGVQPVQQHALHKFKCLIGKNNLVVKYFIVFWFPNTLNTRCNIQLFRTYNLVAKL